MTTEFESIKETLERAIQKERNKARLKRKKISFPPPPKGMKSLRGKPILKQCLYTFEEEDYI